MKQQEAKRKQWAPVVAEFERSGMSQAQFTSQAGVSLPNFRYWLYRLRRERSSTAAVTARPAASVRLVPVEVKPSAFSRSYLEMRIAGVRLRVPVGTDPAYVAQVAMTLRKSAAC